MWLLARYPEYGCRQDVVDERNGRLGQVLPTEDETLAALLACHVELRLIERL